MLSSCPYCDLCPGQQHWPRWAEGWPASGPVWWPSPSPEPPPCPPPRQPEPGCGRDCSCSPPRNRPWWMWWSQSSVGCCPGPDYCSPATVPPGGSQTEGFPVEKETNSHYLCKSKYIMKLMGKKLQLDIIRFFPPNNSLLHSKTTVATHLQLDMKI